jgi:hypothetical protein
MNRVEGWGINWSFSLFLLITAGCTLKYKNENFEYFCRQIQNHGKSTKSIKIDSKINQNQHFYMFCVPWGVALPTS